MTDLKAACAHAHVFFDSAGAGICLDCHAEISRSKAFDAPKKQTTVEPTEVQLLRALVEIQGQWIDLNASAIDTLEALARHERECDQDAPSFFFFKVHMNLKLTALHRHACALAADATFLRQQLRESFPNGN